MDRETQAKYEIVVEARDGQGLRGESGTATVLINLQDVNDNFPIFSQGEPLSQDPRRADVGGSGTGTAFPTVGRSEGESDVEMGSLPVLRVSYERSATPQTGQFS